MPDQIDNSMSERRELVWRILDSLDYGDGLKTFDQLGASLSDLTFDELKIFLLGYAELSKELVTPAHLCACFLILEGVVGYDDFLSYTEAIVTLPREMYLTCANQPDLILENPYLRDLLEDDVPLYATLASRIGKERFGQTWEEYQRSVLATCRIDIDSIELEGRSGFDCVNADLCETLVPKLYQKYGSDSF
jgi:hypothetical protein